MNTSELQERKKTAQQQIDLPSTVSFNIICARTVQHTYMHKHTYVHLYIQGAFFILQSTQNAHGEQEYTHLNTTENATSTTAFSTTPQSQRPANPEISFNVKVTLDNLQVASAKGLTPQRQERPEISQEARQKFQREVESLKRSSNDEQDSGNETYKEYVFNEAKIYRDFKEEF